MQESCANLENILFLILFQVGITFPEGRRRVSRQMLTDMNVAQLQVIVNDLHTQIECEWIFLIKIHYKILIIPCLYCIGHYETNSLLFRFEWGACEISYGNGWTAHESRFYVGWHWRPYSIFVSLFISIFPHNFVIIVHR